MQQALLSEVDSDGTGVKCDIRRTFSFEKSYDADEVENLLLGSCQQGQLLYEGARQHPARHPGRKAGLPRHRLIQPQNFHPPLHDIHGKLSP